MPPISQQPDALLDPLQGFDFDVQVNRYSAGATVATDILAGAFTGLMARIVNQSEVYLPFGARVPRILDGEIITVWHLEQGAVNDHYIANAFGAEFATAFKDGRSTAIPRQQRFQIVISTHLSTLVSETTGEENFAGLSANGVSGAKTGAANLFKIKIHFARVDSGSFGVAAGKRVAMSAWQGTAQSLTVEQRA